MGKIIGNLHVLEMISKIKVKFLRKQANLTVFNATNEELLAGTKSIAAKGTSALTKNGLRTTQMFQKRAILKHWKPSIAFDAASADAHHILAFVYEYQLTTRKHFNKFGTP